MFAPTLTADSGAEYVDEYKGTQIRINKVGLGVVGHTYTGEYWEYMVVSRRGEVVMHGTDLYIGRSATHSVAALFVLDILIEMTGGK